MKNTVIAAVVLILGVAGVGYMLGSNNEQEDTSNLSSNTTRTQPEDNQAQSNRVDLTNKQLTSVPEDILGQTDITELDLSNNQIASLPREIANMKNLEVLNIENNRIESFPEEISKLKSLKRIMANNNRLTSLSQQLQTMTWLEYIDISGNTIPSDQIEELKRNLPNVEIKS